MITLALDTSTAVVAAAVLEGREVLASGGVIADRGQGEELAPLVRRVLEGVGLTRADRVVVGVGPGPFTGLRVGLVTAAVLARVWGAELVGVCSLDAFGRRAVAERNSALPATEFVVATEARRGEVYWALYSVEGRRLGEPAVEPPALAIAAAGGRWAVGPAVWARREAFETAGVVVAGPEFIDAAELALVIDDNPDAALPCTPLYLRRPDATPPGPRKSVTP